MKTYVRKSLILVLHFALLAHTEVHSGEKREIVFTDVLDAPKIVGIELPARPFVESAFAIREIVSAHLAHVERPGGLTIAKNLRVVLATLREGEQSVAKSPMSIRGYLQEFADKWNVVILIHDDTIMVVEPYDRDRFQHQVVVLPQKK
ncbi:hypothetical protein [Brevifollis gellanilyticus]|uniref:Uncharacterized protein n=1 Tax=Brevifollis gellanilyticus TaxID=748831 RepID=A0A512M4T8_9BACT|nr:hypothetical protein [Brevifollis gellanilyticus]GEP41371.1 hypothetical protein BGE01nite_06620 [Brevifollis gellanilyticus]